MLNWCAYCQKFISQTAPHDDFSVSHGICQGCVNIHHGLPEDIPENIIKVAEFYKTVWASAQQGRPVPPEDILRESESLNISLSDLMLGILQPMLMEIGNEFAAGTLSVATEHQFSQTVTKLISLLDLDDATEEPVDVLVICADGNYHSIGPYFLKSLLNEHGFCAKVITPGLPIEETKEAILSTLPRCVGISVSLESQIPYVNELGQLLESSVPVFVGGSIFQTPDSHAASMIQPPLRLGSNDELLGFLRGAVITEPASPPN